MISFDGDIPKLSLKTRAIKFHFKTFTGWLLTITFFAIIWAFLYEFVFPNIEGWWEWSYAFGKVFNGIILSLIASCIFYFVFSYVPEKRKSNRIKKRVEYYLFQLYKLGEQITQDIGGVSSIEKITSQDWKEKCEIFPETQIPRRTIFNISGSPITWFEYFDKILEHEDYYINLLSDFQNFLPIEVVEDIKTIKDPQGFRSQLNTFKLLYLERRTSVEGTIIYTSLSQFAGTLNNHISNLRNVLFDYQIAIIG